MEMNRKKHELEKAIPHYHQMIDFYLSRGPTYAWTTRKIITDQFKKKKNATTTTSYCNINERRRKEALLFSLSLQSLQWSFVYYRYAQRVPREIEIQNQGIPKNHGLKNSQEPGREKTLPWSSLGSLWLKIVPPPLPLQGSLFSQFP